MSVVTVEQLKQYMSGINMSTKNKESAQGILDGVQSELEMYINRPIVTRLVREVALTDGFGTVYLTQSPIIGINTITPADSIFTSSLIPGEPIILDPLDPQDGMESYDNVPENFGRDLIVPGGVVTAYPESAVVVEYICGGGDFLQPYMAAIQIAILRVAARDFQTKNDNTMSLRDTEGRTPSDPVAVQGLGWQPNELVKFDRIRRRVVL